MTRSQLAEKQPINRRRFGRAITVAAIAGFAGCAGGSGGDGQNADPDFENEEEETNPEGSVTVDDQAGQGESIDVDHATANVDFRLVIEYPGGTINSDVIQGGTSVSRTVELDPPIRSSGEFSARVVATNGDVLDNDAFRYEVKPPGPELSIESAGDLLSSRTRTFGPWLIFEGGEATDVQGDADGYELVFLWYHGYPAVLAWEDLSEKTEAQVAHINAAFFQAIYQSDYEIKSATAHTQQYQGDDDVGEPITQPSGKVTVTRETAEGVNWDRLVDHGSFPEGMKKSSDEYDFTFHEPPD